MPNTNYRKGRAFEYRVKESFEKRGYHVRRNPCSKPHDLLVGREGRNQFVCECKKSSKKAIYIYSPDVRDLIEGAKANYAKPIVVYGFYRTDIYVRPVEKEEDLKLEPGMTLDEFIDNAEGRRV